MPSTKRRPRATSAAGAFGRPVRRIAVRLPVALAERLDEIAAATLTPEDYPMNRTLVLVDLLEQARMRGVELRARDDRRTASPRERVTRLINVRVPVDLLVWLDERVKQLRAETGRHVRRAEVVRWALGEALDGL